MTRGRAIFNPSIGGCGKALVSRWLRAAAAASVTLVAAAAPAQAATEGGTDGGLAIASMEPALAGLLAMAALAAMWWRLLARSDEQEAERVAQRRYGRDGAPEDG